MDAQLVSIVYLNQLNGWTLVACLPGSQITKMTCANMNPNIYDNDGLYLIYPFAKLTGNGQVEAVGTVDPAYLLVLNNLIHP